MTTILSLDPSSYRCGAAYWPSIEGRNPQPSFLHLISPPASLASAERIDAIVDGVLSLCRNFLPDVVVMEYTLGKVAGRLAGRKVSGLAVLGQAQGRLYQALVDAVRHRTSRFDPEAIVPVSEVWTGRTGKGERALRIAATCPLYREFLSSGKDGPWTGVGKWNGKGLDCADAIGLGWWHIARMAENTLMETCGRVVKTPKYKGKIPRAVIRRAVKAAAKRRTE